MRFEEAFRVGHRRSRLPQVEAADRVLLEVGVPPGVRSSDRRRGLRRRQVPWAAVYASLASAAPCRATSVGVKSARVT
jgi:hypothetical protein